MANNKILSPSPIKNTIDTDLTRGVTGARHPKPVRGGGLRPRGAHPFHFGAR